MGGSAGTMLLTQQNMSDGFLKNCFSPLVEWKELTRDDVTTTQTFREASAITQCSRSSPVTSDNCGKLVLNRPKLKKHCRKGVHPDVRKRLWLDVVGVTDADSVLLIKAFGEPDEQEQVVSDGRTLGLTYDLLCFSSFHLRLASFVPARDRVLVAVCRKLLHNQQKEHVDRLHAPLIPVLVHLMLHFIDEWEVFAVLSHVLARTAWLDHNRAQVAASHSTLIQLLHSHAASSLSALQCLKPDSMTADVFLDHLTRNWFLWPFYMQPFWMAVRVLDMYFVEGPKFLFRLALSGLKLFASLTKTIEPENVNTCVQEVLCTASSQQKARWFHDAVAIPRLSWRHILKVWQAHTPNSLSTAETDSVDSGDSVDIGGEEVDQVLVIPDPSSEIIQTPEQWETIWQWFPEWVICKEPQCIFRASRDGYNLRTLYRLSEEHQCVLLLIKSANMNVFGAFITTELSERHNSQFFGTGETFLFSLSPSVECYKWTAETDLILRANDQEIIVGAGGGVYGLWLDSDLNCGSSSTCTAFQNPPLCGADGQFTCISIEVYSCN